MAVIRMAGFSGETPALLPRLLPDNSAQIAQNARLERGDLAPLRTSALVHTFSSTMQTIYRFRGAWIGRAEIAKIVQAPVAENRLYMTLAEGTPKMLVDGTTEHELAVPRPTTAPTVAVTGTVNPDLSSTTIYVYTFVTQYDEESEPSPPSTGQLVSPSLTVALSAMQVRSDRGINRRRIYRSQTSGSGATEFYLVAEQAVSLATYSEVPANVPIQEVLPSADYNTPPNDLRGIVALPNGIMAAFAGKKLYFCEPFLPHAWPEKYILTTDYEIVGLGVFGQSVVVTTVGHPYIASGLTPDAMTMERLRVNLPCVASRGIVDLGQGVVYPSTRGLVMVGQGGAQIVTEGMMTPDQWRQLTPESMIASEVNGRYVASYTIRGTTYTGLILVDLSGQQPFVLRGSDTFQAVFSEIGTGKLFMLSGGTLVYEWDAPAAPAAEYLWRSKVHHLAQAVNFSAILVEGEDGMNATERAANKLRWSATALANEVVSVGNPPVWLEPVTAGYVNGGITPPAGFSVAVYADGRLVAVVTDMNRPARLPGGFIAMRWEVEVRGNQRVNTINLASSLPELAGG